MYISLPKIHVNIHRKLYFAEKNNKFTAANKYVIMSNVYNALYLVEEYGQILQYSKTRKQ